MADVRGGKFIGSADWVHEDLTAQIDGIGALFTTSAAYKSGKLLIFLNGLELSEGASKDYTEISSTKFNLNYVPIVGESLEVWYIKN